MSTHTSQVTGTTNALPDPEMKDCPEKRDHEMTDNPAMKDPETTASREMIVHLRATNIEGVPPAAGATVHSARENSSEITTETTIETVTIVGEARCNLDVSGWAL